MSLVLVLERSLAPPEERGLRLARVSPAPGMNFVARLCTYAWIVVLLGAIALVCRVASVNLARADQLSALAGGETIVTDATSPTGYADGLRKLVLPELNHESFQAIAQTQQMLARREWRIRHTDADNASVGRAVFAPSPYRWWLGAVAWVDSRLSGRPLGQSVERAAILSGPILQILLLVGATLFVARFFGPLAATLLAAALTFLFPLAGNFLSPLAGDRELAQVLAVWAVLPLFAAVAGSCTAVGVRRLFIVAGVAGGLALWLDVSSAVPLLLGWAVGGLLAAWVQRRGRGTVAAESAGVMPWRLWAWAGAGMSLAAYVAEYAPAHLAGWRLEWNHPLYAMGWLGLGELLHRGARWVGEGLRPASKGSWLAIGAAGLAFAALPLALLFTDGDGLFGASGHTWRLSLLPESEAAAGLFTWMFRAPNAQIVAVLVPLALLLPAGWCLWSRGSGVLPAATALALGPVLVLLACGGWHLSLWATLNAALLGLLVVLTARRVGRSRVEVSAWVALVAASLVPAAIAVWPKDGATATGEIAVSDMEFELLLQRDLARWLVDRAPESGAVVLAPPAMTSALYYFGGIRGLGSLDPASREGYAVAVRICATTSSDEGEALSRKRELTHILLPSWDGALEEYTKLGCNRPEKALFTSLSNWLPPRWLRPVSYVVPQSDGAGTRSLAVFEVTDLQEQGGALARLTEYFVEMGQLERAIMAAAALEHAFAEDPNALIARGAVAGARGDKAGLESMLRALRPMLDGGEDADLPWDRRVALAVLLAQARQTELAKPRIADCIATIDEARLRQLSTMTLFRLQLIAKAYGVQIEDAAVRERARKLLPAEMRARL